MAQTPSFASIATIVCKAATSIRTSGERKFGGLVVSSAAFVRAENDRMIAGNCRLSRSRKLKLATKSEQRSLRWRLCLRADPAENATAVRRALRACRDRPFYGGE